MSSSDVPECQPSNFSIRTIRYGAYYEAFTKMFPTPPGETTVHYLPGNNDVGLNMDPIESQHARRRFVEHFGPLDQTITVQNHTLVLLDASRIIEEDYRRLRAGPNHESRDGTTGFVMSLPPGPSLILCSWQEDTEGSDFDFILCRQQDTSGHPVYPHSSFPT